MRPVAFAPLLSLSAFTACALLLSACGAFEGDAGIDAEGTAPLSIVDGTPDAVGVLSLLNDPSTTLTVLDDEVPLDKRAATNLIEHRDGPDGAYPSSDDSRFYSVEDVDDVSWVGPSAIDRLVAFALASGHTPVGGNLLGVFDDVAFTVDEADATLLLVNSVAHPYLDDVVALNSRVADGIVALRPFDSLSELAAVPWLGPSAMLDLRDYASDWTPGDPDGQPGDDDDSAPVDDGAGLGEDCWEDDGCANGLACMGHIAWGQGWCIDDSQVGTFDAAPDVAIPDDSNSGVVSSVDVSGLASVPIDIQVTADIEHDDLGQLVLVLTDPNGQQALLSAPGEGGVCDIYSSEISSDDMVNGTWKLQVIDPSSGATGHWHSWSLYLTSNWD